MQLSSPPQSIDKSKMEIEYVRGGGGTGYNYMASRKSTSSQKSTSSSKDHLGRVIPKPEVRARISSAASNDEKAIVRRDKESDGGRNRQQQQERKLTSTMSSGSSGGGHGSSDGGSASRRVSLAVEEELVDGWPKWLVDNIPRYALAGLIPRSAGAYVKLDKVGQGTYSNVYKARDRETGKIVALKKVRFDTSEPESVKFMAREIMFLRKLDHPNIMKLEGLATSRMQYSLYLVFAYMQTDLSQIISRPDECLTESQVKCYMQQLLSGLQHCHERGILHRDIKGSNLLIDKDGMLKITDFGLANYYNPEKRKPLTNRVVTLWYRAPELLLGTTSYGPGIDLWSAGCLMAEMFLARPILPGRTEVEQLHKIFKLCGTPSEEYWKRLRVSTTFRPPHSYKPNIREAFRDLPKSALGLLNILLSIDPAYRGCAGSALQNEFFYTSPLACDLSGLPVIAMEDDDETQTERRKHRRSRMRQRSRTVKEHQRKDEATENLDVGESTALKEEGENKASVVVQSQEPVVPATSPSSTTRPNPKWEENPRRLPSSPEAAYAMYI